LVCFLDGMLFRWDAIETGCYPVSTMPFGYVGRDRIRS